MNELHLQPGECKCLTDSDYVVGEREVNDLLTKCRIIEGQRDECLKELERNKGTK